MIDIRGAIEHSIATKKQVIEFCLSDIQSSVELMIRAAKENKSIFWCGNGGSAADSQHMAAELMGGLRSHDRRPVKSIALTTDSSFITAWSNDTDFASIFTRQIEAFEGITGLTIGLSTSGQSKNVINALEFSKNIGITTCLICGDNQIPLDKFDFILKIPSKDTATVQTVTQVLYHSICELVED